VPKLLLLAPALLASRTQTTTFVRRRVVREVPAVTDAAVGAAARLTHTCPLMLERWHRVFIDGPVTVRQELLSAVAAPGSASS